ncbi:GNAT family N-acetyltransferase [Maribacter aestuarii]|uniref:GNAT family N-acetyltransferase n=1 Tax=Maribacter aestuarii TaxID=1130723 RepID=UPI00248BFE78|nr:GNAT family N-acetyltransferase [Maribacter aestuarii]
MSILLKTLEVHEISSKVGVERYKHHLNMVDPENPYYKYELLNVDYQKNNNLMYFVFFVENSPKVLMPFYLNPIITKGRKTTYKDVSSPWGYTGPLLEKNCKVDILRDFWKEVDDWYMAENIISEFIRFNFSGNHRNYSGKVVHTLSNVRGNILDEQVLWNNFNRSVRKNYNNAQKYDLEFQLWHDEIQSTQIEEFYSIYIGTMDRHDAKDNFYHTLEYFSNFILKNKGRCSLAIVYLGEIAVSTELVLLSNDTMYSFLGGTNSEYFHVRPNDFLKINMLNWARKKGLKYYIIGGGLSDGDSLYKYKKSFFQKMRI